MSDLWLWNCQKPNVALMVSCTPSNNICCALFSLGGAYGVKSMSSPPPTRGSRFLSLSARKMDLQFFFGRDCYYHVAYGRLFHRLGIADMIGYKLWTWRYREGENLCPILTRCPPPPSGGLICWTCFKRLLRCTFFNCSDYFRNVMFKLYLDTDDINISEIIWRAPKLCIKN